MAGQDACTSREEVISRIKSVEQNTTSKGGKKTNYTGKTTNNQ